VPEHDDNEGGTWAVPGEESHEHEDALSPEERGEDPQDVPPPSEPKQPAPPG
jgi:hypothetical protein